MPFIFIGIFVLILLFFVTKSFVFQRQGSEVAGIIALWGIAIGLTLAAILMILSFFLFGPWFLLIFCLIQLVLIANDHLFYFIRWLSGRRAPLYIYYSILGLAYTSLLLLNIYEQVSVYFSFSILVGLLLFWLGCFALLSKNIRLYSHLLGRDDFDYRHWFFLKNYRSTSLEKDKEILGKVFDILILKGYSRGIHAMLSGFIYQGDRLNTDPYPIGFWLLDHYYNKLEKQQKERALDLFSSRNTYTAKQIIRNQKGVLRHWIVAAETSIACQLFLETFLEKRANSLMPDVAANTYIKKQQKKFGQDPIPIPDLFKDSSFGEESKIYKALQSISTSLKNKL